MIKIEQYAKSKQGNSQSMKNMANTVINNIEGSLFEPHYLWGQYFDDTQDIKGDLKDVGNITAKGDISSDSVTTNNVTANNITANEKVIAKSVEAENGKINNISSTNISTDNITVKNNIEAEKAVINELLSGKISVENLKVTKQAHFFKLIIDEMKSVGGTQIITPTNCKLDNVIKLPNGDYKCLWKTSDGDRTIANQWLKQDQAICMTFNVANGTSYNAQNKYYWRLVNEVGTTNIEGIDYHYIVLSDTVKDGTSIPTVGDEISQLGYRGTDDKDRQSAIIISSYNTPDIAVEAPSFVQYKGINEFNLTKHQYNVIAANGNKFRGDFKVSTGDSIEDYINKKTEDNKPYIKDGYWWINGKNTGVKVNHSGYRVEAFSSAGSNFFGEGQTDWKATFIIKVWFDEVEITDTLPSTRFVWSRESEYKEGDIAWNNTHTNIGNNLNITYDDLSGDTSFICKFMDEGNENIIKTIII